jgi:hypothetical protein
LVCDALFKLPVKRVELVEQPRVFNCYDGLGGKILHQRDLLIGERTNFLPIDSEHALDFSFPQHWYKHQCTYTPEFHAISTNRFVFEVGHILAQVSNMDCFARAHAAGDRQGRAWVKDDSGLNLLAIGGWQAVRRCHLEAVAFREP